MAPTRPTCPVFLTQTTLTGIRALITLWQMHPNPALTCPRDSAPRLQLQVPRGQDFTLRRQSGAEGGVATLAEGGSPTQLTFTKAPLCTRLPWRLSAEEPACDAGGLQDTQVPWLDREDPQEEEVASHISILA